jgi:hypothetical protein
MPGRAWRGARPRPKRSWKMDTHWVRYRTSTRSRLKAFSLYCNRGGGGGREGERIISADERWRALRRRHFALLSYFLSPPDPIKRTT